MRLFSVAPLLFSSALSAPCLHVVLFGVDRSTSKYFWPPLPFHAPTFDTCACPIKAVRSTLGRLQCMTPHRRLFAAVQLPQWQRRGRDIRLRLRRVRRPRARVAAAAAETGVSTNARSSPHPSALFRPCLRPSECVPARSVPSKPTLLLLTIPSLGVCWTLQPLTIPSPGVCWLVLLWSRKYSLLGSSVVYAELCSR